MWKILVIMFSFSMIVTANKAQYVGVGAHRFALFSATGTGYNAGLPETDPSLLAGNTLFRVGMACLIPYNLKELGTSSMYAGLPLWKGSFCGAFRYFGSSLYNEQTVALSFGKTLCQWFEAGVQINYCRRNRAVLYQRDHVIGSMVALSARISGSFRIGMVFFHQGGCKETETSSGMPVGGLLKISYTDQKDFSANFQFRLDEEITPEWAIGFSYAFTGRVRVHAGILLDGDLRYVLGLGFPFRKLSFTLLMEQHLVLGSTAYCRLEYILGE